MMFFIRCFVLCGLNRQSIYHAATLRDATLRQREADGFFSSCSLKVSYGTFGGSVRQEIRLHPGEACVRILAGGC
jgi:hypothetical protein